jgi:uncharacterized protein
MVNLRRPILIGGLGLTFSAWLLDSVHPAFSHVGGAAVWGAIALGSGIWWLQRQPGNKLDEQKLSLLSVDRPQVEKALSEVETRIDQLAPELEQADAALSVTKLRQQVAQLKADLDRTEFRIAIVGGKSVGKTTLAELLTLHWGLQLSPELSAVSVIDLPALFTESTANSATEVPDTATADLVLFVTAGDLTNAEFETIQTLLNQQQRVLLVFNKQDQFLPADRPTVLHQLREHVKAHVPIEDVVAIAANPSVVKVRQHQADGSVAEHVEQPIPDLAPLTDRLTPLVAHYRQQLIFATVMRQAIALRASLQTELNRVRRDRAMPLIEQYQWIAAAAAFANPVPSLDLLATAAITTQLVTDLAGLYQQQFSAEQAKTIAGTLASQMVKLGLVEMTSQAVTHLLKSNALTYVAGGLLQGVSAAYLTRLAGLSLIEYFQEQSANSAPESGLQVDRLIQKLKAVFQENQRTAFLQTLVKQGIQRLGSEPAPVVAATLPIAAEPS